MKNKTAQKTIKLFSIVLAAVIGTVLAGCASTRLEYLEADTVSGPAQVRQGMDINPREITVWGIYKDGSRKVVGLGRGNINFNNHTPGRQTVRIRVGILTSQEVSFETEVMALRSLTIASPPRVALFKQGDVPDPTWPGLEVRGEWNQMGSDKIDISRCQITGYMKDQAGRQTLRVVFEGLTATFDVNVRAMASIEIAQTPTKLEYLQGDLLELDGLKVMGVWDGFPPEELEITLDDITGYNPNNRGNQRLTVTKNGRTTTFTVSVFGLTGISVTVYPTKRTYYRGEELDLSGLVVTGNYTSGSSASSRTEPIPRERISTRNYNPNLVGEQVVTLYVEGAAAGVTATFPVTVRPNNQNNEAL